VRIHITGMSPRQVSRRAREQMTFASTLELALIGMGHDVYRGPDNDDLTDLVIGGVTSALSPGATYALVGLETIGCALDKGLPVLLFVDDPDLGKTRAGAQSALRDLDRLYSPYLMGKRVAQSRHLTTRQRTSVSTALEMLAEENWAPVLVPLHPWADDAIAAKRLGIVSGVIPVDVSSAVELPPVHPLKHNAGVWLTDSHYSSHTLDPDRVSWPVIPINSATMKDPCRIYAVARGVHQGAIDRMPGWWTPTPLFVAYAGTVYLCDAEEGRAIGVNGPYYLTPDQVEWLADEDHHEFAQAQAAHLKETMWSRATLFSVLADSIGRVSSSGKRATTRRPQLT
jgi:hypothetical protein